LDTSGTLDFNYTHRNDERPRELPPCHEHPAYEEKKEPEKCERCWTNWRHIWQSERLRKMLSIWTRKSTSLSKSAPTSARSRKSRRPCPSRSRISSGSA